MPVLSVTQQTFEQEVLTSNIPVLVDLYADWCGPCKQMAPILDELADEYAGRLKIVKVDIEANPGIAQAFRVQSIPMLVFMQDGRPVEAIRGAVGKADLVSAINELVGTSTGGVQTWDVKQAAAELKEKRVRPVDVRPENDYGRARLPGAVNAPPETFAALIPKLSGIKRTLLFYSRDSKDLQELADQAAAAGATVAILEGGLLGWEAESQKVEKGSPSVELM